MFIVFFQEIELVLANPRVFTLWAEAGAFRHAAVVCHTTTSGNEAGLGVLKGIQKTSGSVQLVHVDDLCRAELFVAEEDAAVGRYICCALNTTVVELARFLARKYPQYNVKTNL